MPFVARVQHTYVHKSGLPEHGVVNTFYFQSPLDQFGGTMAEDLANVVIGFYDSTHGGSHTALHALIAETSMSPQRHLVKVYNMADQEPRAPHLTLQEAPPDANNAQPPMPSEVALCLSYRAELVSGMKPARRRGRVYIGPLSSGVVVQDAAGWARPDPLFRDMMTLAAAGMHEDALNEGFVWMLQSGAGTSGDPDIPLGYVPIVHCWVDNAFDTQRRRGADPTARTMIDL